MLPWFGPKPRLALILCLLLLALPFPGRASSPSDICERAIVEGARKHGVPQRVLHAISLTETGRHIGGKLRPWPWAVNREGQGHWFKNRDEALAFARRSVALGRHSFDVGCFQINYLWHGQHFPSVEAMFDPATAAAYASKFLNELYAETGDWSRAAGAYHSRTPHYARIYRARFDQIYAGLGGKILTVASADAGTESDEGQPAEKRKQRLRMKRGPLIINISTDAAPLAPGIVPIEVARLEKTLSEPRRKPPRRFASNTGSVRDEYGSSWQPASGTRRMAGPQ